MKTQREKQIRALYKELRRMGDRIRDAEVVELDQPYQRGWVRYFKWSDEATQREDFHLMEGVLEILQYKQWSRDRDFRRLDWHMPIWYHKNWKPRLSYHPHELLRACTDPSWVKYFSINAYQPVRGVEHLRDLIQRGWNGKLRFNHPQLLEKCVEPFMVTHIKRVDSEAESRTQEIETWIDHQGGWDVIGRALGHRSYRYVSDRRKIKDRVVRLETQAELEERGFSRAFRVLWGRLFIESNLMGTSDLRPFCNNSAHSD